MKMTKKLRTRAPKAEKEKCPADSANPISIITFSWLNSIMATGIRRTLEMADIPTLPAELRASVTASKLKTLLAGNNTEKTKSDIKTVVCVYARRSLLFAGIVRVVGDISISLIPIVMRELLIYTAISKTENTSISEGILYVCLLLLFGVVNSLCFNWAYQRGYMFGSTYC